MKQWRKNLIQISFIFAVTLLVGVMFASVSHAQDPRPPIGGGGNGGNGGSSDGSGNGSSDTPPGDPTCAALKGQVLNWGSGGMGGVQLDLGNGSWQLTTASATDGNYGFGGLGVGVAKLGVTVPSALGQLQPHVKDAAIYLNCNYPVVANLAVSGAEVTPPATIEMSAPGGLTPGENTVVRLVVKNTLPNDISNVSITNLLPQGLTPVQVDTNTGNVHIVDSSEFGQLVFVYFNRIPSNAEENILVTLAAADDLPIGSQLENTATLFYSESVGDQASMSFTVGTGGLSVPVAATEAQTSELESASITVTDTTVAPTPVVTETLEADETHEGEDFVPPSKLPTTGDDFSPPPGMLPETGFSTFAVPESLADIGLTAMGLAVVCGIALGGVAGVYRWRKSR